MEKKKVYAVATAHLDTVWRWNLATTIKEYLPNTLEQNFNLIEKYPNYRFNFEEDGSTLKYNLNGRANVAFFKVMDINENSLLKGS